MKFVDREDLIRITENWVGNNNKKRVLNFFGIGGIGKSCLKNELYRRYSQTENVSVISIDFKTSHFRHLPKFLFQIRLQLGKQLKISFNNFDLAYTIYFKVVIPSFSLSEPANLLEEGNLIAEILTSLQGFPMVETIPKMLLLLKKRIKWFNEWMRRKQPIFQEFIDLAEQRRIYELEDRLSYFLFDDLQLYCEQNLNQKLIFLIDSFEHLTPKQERTFLSRYQRDEWFRNTILNLSLVKWIIFGRDKILWAEIDERWEDIILQKRVKDLEMPFRKTILQNLEIEQKLHEEIAECSYGVPLYLYLSKDMYERAIKHKKFLTAEDIQPNINQLLGCFFHYLSREEQTALFLFSIPRFWNDDLWHILINKFQPSLKTYRLSEFCNFSFIDVDKNGNIYFHPLLRDLLLKKEENRFKEVKNKFLANYYRNFANIEDIKNITNDHIDAFQEALYHYLQLENIDDVNTWFWSLLFPYKSAGFYSLILPVIYQLIEKLQENQNDDLESLSLALNNLGDILQEIAEYREAEETFQRSLSFAKQCFNENHPRIGSILQNLGTLYIKMGFYDKAEPLLAQALEIDRTHYGEKHVSTGIVLNNYANLLSKLGRNHEAENYARLSISIAEEILGDDHLDVATKLSTLAGILTNLGRFNEAEPLYRRSLSIAEKRSGEDSILTSIALNNLAIHLESFGDISQKFEAEKLYYRALKIARAKLGDEHPKIGRRLNNLGLLKKNLGKIDEAEPLLKEALIITENALGSDHPETAIRLNNLGLLYDDTDRLDKAEPLFRKALEITEKKQGKEHPKVVKRLNNLASLLRKKKEFSEAESLFRRAIKIAEEKLGVNHPLTGKTYNNFGLLLLEIRTKDSYKEAEVLLRKALKISEETFEPESSEVDTRLDNLTRCLIEKKKYKEAEPLCRRFLNLARQKLGKNHIETARRMYLLGHCTHKLNKLEEAEKLYEKAFRITKDKLGPNNRRTILFYASYSKLRNQRKEG